ncbi:UNVERIFIED_CONTAM: hypothetical protein Slati_1415100 [Sesamum latifolium]|uniref:Uncharacterized protein n=1 Tax=Sesamum latifolium TaxID=2727402 RepID=A0AAW2X2Z4_9LAMI
MVDNRRHKGMISTNPIEPPKQKVPGQASNQLLSGGEQLSTGISPSESSPSIPGKDVNFPAVHSSHQHEFSSIQRTISTGSDCADYLSNGDGGPELITVPIVFMAGGNRVGGGQRGRGGRGTVGGES